METSLIQNLQSDQSNIANTVTVAIVVFLQSVIAILTLIYSIARGFKHLIPKYFMGSMIILGLVVSCVSRGITSFYFLMQSFGEFQDISPKYQICNFIYIPNACFFLFIFPLFWQMLIVQYESRIKKFDVMNEQKPIPPQRKWAMIAFWIAYCSDILIQAAIVLDFNFGTYSQSFSGNVNDYMGVLSYLNYIECGLMVIVEIVLYCKQLAGIPFLNEKMQKKNAYIFKLLNYCICTRFVYALIIDILLEEMPQVFSPDYDFQGLNGFLKFLYPMIYFVLYILVEFIPAFFTLDITAIRIFQMNQAKNYRGSQLTEALYQNDQNNQQSIFMSNQQLDQNYQVQQQVTVFQKVHIKNQNDQQQQYQNSRNSQNTYSTKNINFNNNNISKQGINRYTQNSIDTSDQSQKQYEVKSSYKLLQQLIGELQNVKSFQSLELVSSDDISQSQNQNQNQNQRDSSSNNNNINNSNRSLNQIQQKQNGSFGKIQIYQIRFLKLNFIIRSVPVKKISNYLYEEVLADFKYFQKLQMENVEKPLKLFKENNFIHIAYQLYPNGSLRNFLESSKFQDQMKLQNSKITEKSVEQSVSGSQSNFSNFKEKNQQLSLEAKIRICIQICEIMIDLHEKNLVHGHLHMENILIDQDFGIAISGLGFKSLKKLQSFTNGYQNIGYYTAPEYLEKDKNKFQYIANAQTSQDVYSFAFILFELFYEIQPFKNIQLKQLRQIIVVDGKRPKKNNEILVPDQIDVLIDNCWISDPEKRPSFIQISNNIKKIQNQISEQFQ